MTLQQYPSLLERMKAVVADYVVMIIFFIMFTYIFEAIGDVSNGVRIGALIFLVGLYDPLCTSLLGGTLGHLMIGLRVRRQSDFDKKIIFPLAIVRFAIKSFLGIISLLTVSGHPNKLAIHDVAVGSVVIYKKKS